MSKEKVNEVVSASPLSCFALVLLILAPAFVRGSPCHRHALQIARAHTHTHTPLPTVHFTRLFAILIGETRGEGNLVSSNSVLKHVRQNPSRACMQGQGYVICGRMLQRSNLVEIQRVAHEDLSCVQRVQVLCALLTELH